MRLRQGRWLVPLAAVVFLGVASGPASAAPPPVEVENLRVGFTSAAKNNLNLFKIGAWTPVWVQLRAGAEGFLGYLDVVAPDDDGTPTVFRQSIQVPVGQSRRFISYARPGTRDPEFTVRVLDRTGRHPLDVNTINTGAQLAPIEADDLLLITLGKPLGVEMIPSVSGFSPGPNAPGTPVTVGGFDTIGNALPDRWYGYDGAVAIVLDTNDRGVMKELATPRGLALEEWVKRGGHLVVAIGGNWQAVKDSFLGPMLPAVPTGQERVSSLEALDSFAGASKPITPPGATPVMVTKFEDVESRGGKVLAATAGLPLVIRGPDGFGQVTVVAFDVDQKPFGNWADRHLFWVRALDLRRRATELSGNAPGTVAMVGGRALYQSGVNNLASRLRRALEQFPGVQLVPFGWVAFFIVLYILLIGPGDYLFLKKVLKRMELTWITFPLIVVTVSLLAYCAVSILKGNELRVNKIDIVDVDQPAGLARGNSWLNVFSPRNRDYAVKVVPLRLDRPAPDDGGELLKPPVGTEVQVSWFGDPENQFGGMGQSGRLDFSGGGYEYQPVGGAESLKGVRIPIWSTKTLTARWFGPGPALLDADLHPAGPDRLAGTVTNRLDIPLYDALLAYGRQVYLLGTIPPRGTVRIELAQDRFLSGHLKAVAGKYAPARPWNDNQQVSISRPDLALALMFHDSQSAASSEAALSNNMLHDLDLTGQLLLGRPMLVARVERPASRLVLDNTARIPKTDETTMLRVILPLNDKSEAEASK